jgi:hypothetical protein
MTAGDSNSASALPLSAAARLMAAVKQPLLITGFKDFLPKTKENSHHIINGANPFT